VEGIAADLLLTLAGAGYVALIVVPVGFMASVVVRGIVSAWRQDDALALIERDGSTPRLAGWLVTAAIGGVLFVLAMHHGTRLLLGTIELQPNKLGFAAALLAVGSGGLLLAISVPSARLFSGLAQRLERRWQRRGRGVLLTPRRSIAAVVVLVSGLVAVIWLGFVGPQLAAVDLSVLRVPAVVLVVHAVVPAVLGRLRRRVIIGCSLIVGCLGVGAVATFVRFERPSLALDVWGEGAVAGFAIEKIFGLDAIRDDVTMEYIRPQPKAGEDHPDIVLVTIDTVRADRTPPYGGPARMPALADLARRGSVFTWAFAPSNVTRRSLPTIAIGLLPNEVRGRTVGWGLRVDPRHVMVAERLRAGGYDTAGFMCCPAVWAPHLRTGLSRGLEHFVVEADGANLVEHANRWVTARRSSARSPAFVWMHLIEPHNWTVGRGVSRSNLDDRALYDRSLTRADELLDRFLQRVATHLPRAVIIVTADHGEGLGDHGQLYHSTDLYNSQLRVPLVIAGPGIANQTLAEVVSSVDLVPTIMDLAGFHVPDRVSGRSLADMLRGERAARPDGGVAFAQMIIDRSNRRQMAAVVRGRWKLIQSGGRGELYDIYRDPDEQTNLIGVHPDVAGQLRELVVDQAAQAVTLSAWRLSGAAR
jgi:hypothetical protein